MNLMNLLLVLLCIAATIILSHIKKRLLHFSLKLGSQVPDAKRRKRARMGRN